MLSCRLLYSLSAKSMNSNYYHSVPRQQEIFLSHLYAFFFSFLFIPPPLHTHTPVSKPHVSCTAVALYYTVPTDLPIPKTAQSDLLYHDPDSPRTRGPALSLSPLVRPNNTNDLNRSRSIALLVLLQKTRADWSVSPRPHSPHHTTPSPFPQPVRTAQTSLGDK